MAGVGGSEHSGYYLLRDVSGNGSAERAVLELVRRAPGDKRQALAELGLAESSEKPSREWDTPTMAKCPKRPRHPNQLAKLIVHVALGEQPNDLPRPGPPTPGTEARRKGGLKGGKVRAKTLSEAKRKAIARKAARERWGQG